MLTVELVLSFPSALGASHGYLDCFSIGSMTAFNIFGDTSKEILDPN
ncbi:MAG: hypothetical protein JRI93_04815 [Deltaproteobacteria bacterium]|nr:hypothetical protein [Deltaproteobacteria bacterium]MBW2178492.1 hypothetical protein [Deltaproteobacteria bacterium]MBW2611128.1 hypothetical protein [Deltaproteobacteria bacterium]MBW2634055.1 hypothetical protein [Deltaproteobacteria bacterium]